MKKVITILFLISVVIMIAHDTIHHHHHEDSDNIEALAGSHSNDKNHSDNKNHFPPHQHFISESDLITVRNTTSFNKIIKTGLQELISLTSPSSGFNHISYFVGFVEVREPDFSSICIIPRNTTRGSPSVA